MSFWFGEDGGDVLKTPVVIFLEKIDFQFGKKLAKGTTDPRVEFISQYHSSQFTNFEHFTFQMLD